MRRTHYVIMGAAIVLGGLFGVTAQALNSTVAVPTIGQRVDHDVIYVNGADCPDEDSCMADYDGELEMWVVYELTP